MSSAHTVTVMITAQVFMFRDDFQARIFTCYRSWFKVKWITKFLKALVR